MVEKRFYRPQEAAETLALSRGTIYSLMKSGELPSCKVDGVRLIAREELDTFVARLPREYTASSHHREVVSARRDRGH